MLVLMALTFAQAFDMDFDLGKFVTMFYYVEVMSYGNSLLNPILYFLTSAKFRRAGLLLSKCQRVESGNSYASSKCQGKEVSGSVYVSEKTQDTRL